MKLSRDKIKACLPALLALTAGALLPFSLSPFDIWPLGFISVILLMFVIQGTPPRLAAWLGWFYGLGIFGIGASWVYVSINVYGNASGFFASLLTLLFVAGLALLFALQCWCYQRWFSGYRTAMGFASVWVLFEWLRSWLFTGFPWLYLGYGHLHTWLANIAPVLGVMGISFAVVFISGLLFELFQHWQLQKKLSTAQCAVHAVPLILLVLTSLMLGRFNWVEEVPERRANVALVQANIDQNLKFDPAFIEEGLTLYNDLSLPLWENDIVIWPETAIPMLYQRASNELAFFDFQARSTESTLVSGILYRDDNHIYNSITALGDGAGIYHKQKLVPFGEYVPLSALLEPVLQLFSLPLSSLSSGPGDQQLLQASGYSLAPYICYEVVYPDFVQNQAHEADFLVTISNDTWFGASIGPLQHLQMAAMRALENGRYMVRATSNGVSAIIDERGQILSRTPQFEVATLSQSVPVFTGRTPFSYWGSFPVIVLCLVVGMSIFLRNRRQKPAGKNHAQPD